MIVAVSQPTLFSWIGYYNIIKKVDIFVFLDNVKFKKRDWHTRNKLKITNGEKESWVWITMPTKDITNETLIKDALIDNSQNWGKKHLKMFQSQYGNNYKEIDFLIEMYNKSWNRVNQFNIEFIKNCCQYLDIKTKLISASELMATGKKSELLLNICKELGATEYLTSIGAKEYLENDKEMFEEENIKISYHDFIHPNYKQQGKSFISNLSILDLLFNHKIKSKEYI